MEKKICFIILKNIMLVVNLSNPRGSRRYRIFSLGSSLDSNKLLRRALLFFSSFEEKICILLQSSCNSSYLQSPKTTLNNVAIKTYPIMQTLHFKKIVFSGLTTKLFSLVVYAWWMVIRDEIGWKWGDGIVVKKRKVNLHFLYIESMWWT